jgi:rRNA processing protein Krr1/Pno1
VLIVVFEEVENSSQISVEQILQIRAIVSGYKNFMCVECAEAIKDYLIAQGIKGKHLKLYTGAATGANCYIYDDSIPGEAISVNGHHEGITIVINNIEMVFDNHHPDGVPRNEWMENLLFQGKIHYGQYFELREEEF